MYADEIKGYTTEKQFDDHKRLLKEMKEHFKSNPDVSNPTFEKIRDEERLLARLYRNWKRRNNE